MLIQSHAGEQGTKGSSGYPVHKPDFSVVGGVAEAIQKSALA
jgi:hypothetical protein